MSSDRQGKDVIIDYNGLRSTYRVPAAYPELNLPMKFLGTYFDNDEDLNDPTSDKCANFAPTGKLDMHNGKMLEVWAFRREIES